MTPTPAHSSLLQRQLAAKFDLRSSPLIQSEPPLDLKELIVSGLGLALCVALLIFAL